MSISIGTIRETFKVSQIASKLMSSDDRQVHLFRPPALRFGVWELQLLGLGF